MRPLFAIPRYAYLFIAIMSIIPLIIPSTSGVGIGISPGVIEIGNVRPGGYSATQVLISTSSQEKLSVSLSAEGKMKEWVRFSPQNISIDAKSPGAIQVIVEPPADIPPDTYPGKITVTPSSASSRKEGLNSLILPVVRASLSIRVTGTDLISCVAGGMRIPEVDEGSRLFFSFLITNTGNQRTIPSFDITLWDKNLTTVLGSQKADFHDWILPTETKREEVELPNDLATGTYFLEVEIPSCQASFFEEVTVLPSGTRTDQGTISEIIIPDASVSLGNAVPIRTTFLNNDGRPKSVSFIGKVYRDGRMIDIIETEPLMVGSNETVTVDSFYTPRLSGNYSIVGKILYNNRLTPEVQTSFRVMAENARPIQSTDLRKSGESGSFVLIVLLFGIVCLLLLIIRKKKKHKR